MPDILVIGSLNADLVVRAPHFPQPGETISGDDLQIIPGGKGANQAVAAARQGASVAMLGRVGKDEFGPFLVESLKSNQRGYFARARMTNPQQARPSSSWMQTDRTALSYQREQMAKSHLQDVDTLPT